MVSFGLKVRSFTTTLRRQQIFLFARDVKKKKQKSIPVSFHPVRAPLGLSPHETFINHRLKSTSRMDKKVIRHFDSRFQHFKLGQVFGGFIVNSRLLR